VIVVCGEALIDMVVSGDGTRRPAPGGGPFNAARALARIGVPTAFLGHFSEDQLGRMLADRLALMEPPWRSQALAPSRPALPSPRSARMGWPNMRSSRI